MDEILDAISAEGQAIVRSIAAAKPAMVMQRSDGAIEMCNPCAEEILGLTLRQMRGWSSIDFSGQAIYADGTPFPGESHSAMESLHTRLSYQPDCLTKMS